MNNFKKKHYGKKITGNSYKSIFKTSSISKFDFNLDYSINRVNSKSRLSVFFNWRQKILRSVNIKAYIVKRHTLTCGCSLPSSHWGPVHPAAQQHSNEPGVFEHVASFLHGESEHSLISSRVQIFIFFF